MLSGWSYSLKPESLRVGSRVMNMPDATDVNTLKISFIYTFVFFNKEIGKIQFEFYILYIYSLIKLASIPLMCPLFVKQQQNLMGRRGLLKIQMRTSTTMITTTRAKPTAAVAQTMTPIIQGKKYSRKKKKKKR